MSQNLGDPEKLHYVGYATTQKNGKMKLKMKMKNGKMKLKMKMKMKNGKMKMKVNE